MRYKEIDYCDATPGYEWDEFHVLRGEDGRLYTAHAMGCSCNEFWPWENSDDGFYELNAPHGNIILCSSWVDVCNNIKTWISEGYKDSRDSAGFELISRIADKKPQAFDSSVMKISNE